MAFLLTFATSIASFLYFLFSDVIAIPNRPIVLLGRLGFMTGIASTLASGNLVISAIGAVTAAVVSVGLVALFGRAVRVFGFMAGVALFAESLFQAPHLLFPSDDLASLPFPPSRTGLGTLGQLIVGGFLIIAMADLKVRVPAEASTRFLAVGFIVCFRYMSLSLFAHDVVASWIAMLACLPPLAYILLPRAAITALFNMLEAFARLLYRLARFTFTVLEKVWRVVRWLYTSLLNHPTVLYLHRVLFEPVWVRTTPWIQPILSVLVAKSCVHSMLSAPNARLVVFLGVAVFASCLSFVVMVSHALHRSTRAGSWDPLKYNSFSTVLAVLAQVLSAPLRFSRIVATKLFHRLVTPVIRLVFKQMEALMRFASDAPVLAIPAVVIMNFGILWAVSSGPLAGVWGRVWSVVLSVVGVVFAAIASVLGVSVDGAATDPELALGVVAVLLMGAFSVAHQTIQSVRIVAISASTGAALSTAELNDIAATMRYPRACGRCGFGPVDAYGCNNLRAWNGAVTVSGGIVSNACPRCGWFVSTLSQWQEWDAEINIGNRPVVMRQRAWSELVLTVRSACKLLVIPYTLLHFVGPFSPTLAAALAITYIIPWLVENVAVSEAIFNPLAYHDNNVRRARRGRRAGGNGGGGGGGGAGAGAGGGGDDAPPDCGGGTADPLANRRVAPSAALAALNAAVPRRVFLNAGDVCSICLDEFPNQAASIAANHEGADAVQRLRDLESPIVALRCGHPLHIPCAEAAVRGASGRHVRCPLCREPVTLSGATSSRLFS